MKKVSFVIAIILLVFVLLGCLNIFKADDYFGFSKKDFKVVDENDTHGGFLGDGSYYLILDCSDNKESALKIVEGWKKLPLTENLQVIMFGGEKDGIDYVFGLSEEAHIPEIKNGYYFFEDRYLEHKDSSDDSALLNRASRNFSLAIYDSDTDMFYYFAEDT